MTLIAKTTHHLFQPLLYQVATGVLSEARSPRPPREVLARQANARVLLGEVTHIGLDTRTVAHEVLGRQTVTPMTPSSSRPAPVSRTSAMTSSPSMHRG